MHQAQDVKSAFMRAMPAHRGAARSRDRSALALVGVVVLALMAVTRSVPAQTAPRDTVRQTCAIHFVQTHSSHAVEPAIIRVTVADSLGKPIESASVGYAATAASAMTDSHGTAVLTVSGQSPLGTTLVVRKIGYVAVRVPLRVALGDTVAATAVLCPSPTATPITVTTSPAMRTPSSDRRDTTPRCVSVAAVIRRDTGGRAARVRGNAIIRVHVTDSAGTTAKPIVVSAHLTSAEGGLGSGITDGYTDQYGNVTLTVPASRLGHGTSLVVVVRQISYYAAHATVQLAPGDTVDVKAALCGGAPFLSEAAGKDSAFARSERLSKAGEGRASAFQRAPMQPQRCRTTGDEALVLVAYAKMLAADTSREMQAKRTSYHIPPTDTANVELVTDGAVCARAGDAFNADLPPSLRIADRAVYVVWVGHVYIVTDPAAQPARSGLVPNIVFDRRFRVLARFAA